MLGIHTPSKSLEALVRTALFHGELAPGVAKQIEAYRVDSISRKEARLLEILDDVITDGLVKIIPATNQPTIQTTVAAAESNTETASTQTEPTLIHHTS
ncbi:MAG: hypothetical protein AAF810_21990 [Cyanobacteria bacterium P01_D01_bin.36]